MLVLSRNRDESIHIGDDIVITIVDVRGDRVRIGIKAPNHVAVHRREIYDLIQQEKQATSDGPTEHRAKAPLSKLAPKRQMSAPIAPVEYGDNWQMAGNAMSALSGE